MLNIPYKLSSVNPQTQHDWLLNKLTVSPFMVSSIFYVTETMNKNAVGRLYENSEKHICKEKCWMYRPVRIPSARMSMNGRRLPNRRLQRSLMDPRRGVTKKPTMGDSAHTRVMCSCCTPILSRMGETNAVSAAYENSTPITAAEILTSSQRVFLLKEHLADLRMWPNTLTEVKLAWIVFKWCNLTSS